MTIVNVISKIKTLRFKKMRLYKGQSESEHLRWFREVVIQFMNSFEYFITNQIKIEFYIKFFENDLSVQ